eukprot:12876048-Heterocapsa_arctica.AAC.1
MLCDLVGWPFWRKAPGLGELASHPLAGASSGGADTPRGMFGAGAGAGGLRQPPPPPPGGPPPLGLPLGYGGGGGAALPGARTAQPAADGQNVAVVYLLLAYDARDVLQRETGSAKWVPDGRWPAGRSFDAEHLPKFIS